jgi:hypothetical protein
MVRRGRGWVNESSRSVRARGLVANNSGLAIRPKRSIIALLSTVVVASPLRRSSLISPCKGVEKEELWHIQIGAEFCWEVCWLEW